MKLRHLMLAAGLVFSAGLVLLGDKDLEKGNSRAVVPTLAAEAPARRVQDDVRRERTILALLPRENLIGGARLGQYKDALFASHSWTPPAPPPPEPAPPPPSTPPLPFTYLGKKIEDGQWEVFLARGDQTLIVRTQSAIDARYRVDEIKPPVLTLTYLPLNQVQTLSIGGAE